MSFFSDVLQSIGGDKAPTPPKPSRPRTSTDSRRSSSELSKPVSQLGIQAAPSAGGRVKRKAEDELRKQFDAHSRSAIHLGPPNPHPATSQPNGGHASSGPPKPHPAASQINGARAPKPATKPIASSSKHPPAPAAPKIPAKGSYADIMARARQAQLERGQTQVGMIKHHRTEKEKISRFGERRREEEHKTQNPKSKLGPRPGSNGRIEKRRSVSPVKSKMSARPEKAARGPSVPAPIYRGTMGISSKNREKTRDGLKPGQKSRRNDDYLGTDEEEDSELELADEGDEYGSDVSSDMEAGAFDIDEEENRALRAAREDDLREAELEKKLRLEKEERRRKLQAMSDRGKK